MPIDPDLLSAAEEILGHRFRRPELIGQALRHASITDCRLESNERLEFLGDAVLGMIVCEFLHERFPDLLEGELTKIKSDAVSRRKCARIANHLGLTELLMIGKGMQNRSNLPSSLSAAVLESVLGALYLDAGYDRARNFVRPLLQPIVERAARSGHQQNFKSVLQQHVQQQCGATPCYLLLDEKGPDHDKAFLVGVDIDGDRHGPCWARSKKQAEQMAAREALVNLGLLVEDEDGHAVYVPECKADADADESPVLVADSAD